MTSFVLDLDDESVERLRRRARREGIDVAELAQRLLTEASQQDPFEFIGSYRSDQIGAGDVERFLEEHDLGRS